MNIDAGSASPEASPRRPAQFVQGRAQGPTASFCLAAWGGLRQGVTRIDSTNRTNGLIRLPALHRRAAEAACEMLAARHPVLNCRVEDRDGAPWIVPLPPARAQVSVLEGDWDGSDAGREAAERAVGAFVWSELDVTKGPLYRAYVVSLTPDEAYFGLLVHHFVADPVSIGVLLDEFIALYSGLLRGRRRALPPPPPSYQDYLAAMSEWIEGEDGSRLRRSAFERLKAGSRLDLPELQSPDAPVEAFFQLDPAVAAATRTVAQRLRTSPFTVLLAAQAAMLSAFARGDRVTLRTISNGRDTSVLARTVGNLVNRLYVMTDVAGDPSFAQLIERVKADLNWARRHAFVRDDFIQIDLAAGGVPLEAPVFNYRVSQRGDDQRPALARALKVPPPGTARTRPRDAYYLDMLDNGVDMFGSIRFAARTIDDFLTAFEATLRTVGENPDAPISALAAPLAKGAPKPSPPGASS
ncbi:condensation domain-containing protein [Caulobacter endophyticus]|uniref:condensation domain-containing protein n=1 Tax=Caulobacter endophyticus TaxID=2172652 RepID=UPI00240F53CA|nr:condensation domain-containing protein [Caulobacter endophyticus]MDG2528905.1 condensation domain-containing protein [Caulobacter endophyticus]